MSGKHSWQVWAVVVVAVLLACVAAVSSSSPAYAKPKCAGKPATIVGTNKGDVIKGTPMADVIVARGGNDIVYGRGGDDLICGGPGLDRLVGQRGDDRLFGRQGPDRLSGGFGSDRLYGGWSDDVLDGGPGEDLCREGPGDGELVGCEWVTKIPPKVDLPPAPEPPGFRSTCEDNAGAYVPGPKTYRLFNSLITLSPLCEWTSELPTRRFGEVQTELSEPCLAQGMAATGNVVGMPKSWGCVLLTRPLPREEWDR